jgi:hypothetical protein
MKTLEVLSKYRKYDINNVLFEGNKPYRHKYELISSCFGKDFKVISKGNFVKAYRWINVKEQRWIDEKEGRYYGRIEFLIKTCCNSVYAFIKVYNKGNILPDVDYVWEKAGYLEKTTKAEALIDIL